MCIFKLYSIRLFGYVSKWRLLNLLVKSFCIFSTLSPINQFISTFLMPPMFQTLIELVDKTYASCYHWSCNVLGKENVNKNNY